jgi:mRNA degradation ribonuclease J1/J2
MKAICKNADREFAGALLRPHGTVIKRMLHRNTSVDDIFDAANEAGRQLVADGQMSAETLKAVSRQLMPLEQYKQRANQHFQQLLKDAK